MKLNNFLNFIFCISFYHANAMEETAPSASQIVAEQPSYKDAVEKCFFFTNDKDRDRKIKEFVLHAKLINDFMEQTDKNTLVHYSFGLEKLNSDLKKLEQTTGGKNHHLIISETDKLLSYEEIYIRCLLMHQLLKTINKVLQNENMILIISLLELSMQLQYKIIDKQKLPQKIDSWKTQFELYSKSVETTLENEISRRNINNDKYKGLIAYRILRLDIEAAIEELKSEEKLSSTDMKFITEEKWKQLNEPETIPNYKKIRSLYMIRKAILEKYREKKPIILTEIMNDLEKEKSVINIHELVRTNSISPEIYKGKIDSDSIIIWMRKQITEEKPSDTVLESSLINKVFAQESLSILNSSMEQEPPKPTISKEELEDKMEKKKMFSKDSWNVILNLEL